jgi:hypothetical protein
LSTRRSDTRRPTNSINLAWSISLKKFRMSNSATKVLPSMKPLRTRSIACVADRFGRNPYDTDMKSASKIGSSTSLAAC